MPGKEGSSNTSDSSKSGSSSFAPYIVNNSGTNNQGNNYDNRTQPGGNAYHYSNSDGSYYYKNSDNSTYHNSGKGDATYTAPNGKAYKK
ncbi:hypothetical protein L207DRAFT_587070 [Hyaloscypha variabilis F]|uniref:Uncharacterized protein n=1 Tax=Hyaloscypha variabilis (strain UAMH 11265 / GT02V1 / F) TaxID=1149755 RepID=A0A2J6RC20_HYAVF|nr:hypothetical protein L207DRAFT_587070 [Hyaloscypha variabilis F]